LARLAIQRESWLEWRAILGKHKQQKQQLCRRLENGRGGSANPLDGDPLNIKGEEFLALWHETVLNLCFQAEHGKLMIEQEAETEWRCITLPSLYYREAHGRVMIEWAAETEWWRVTLDIMTYLRENADGCNRMKHV
jgi:hypothetical protein